MHGPESQTQLFLLCDKVITYKRPAGAPCVLSLNDSTLELKSYSITDTYNHSQLITQGLKRVTQHAAWNE